MRNASSRSELRDGGRTRYALDHMPPCLRELFRKVAEQEELVSNILLNIWLRKVRKLGETIYGRLAQTASWIATNWVNSAA